MYSTPGKLHLAEPLAIQKRELCLPTRYLKKKKKNGRALTFPFTAMFPRGTRTRSGGILRRRSSTAAAESWTRPGREVVSMRAEVFT